MKKSERLFIGGILIFALLLWVLLHLLRPHDYGSIRITVDGEEYGTYRLSEDQTVSIGSTNICEIKDGKAKMIHADCPDQLCMKQGAIDDSGGMIICLPNKVIIEGEKTSSSGSGSFVDAVS